MSVQVDFEVFDPRVMTPELTSAIGNGYVILPHALPSLLPAIPVRKVGPAKVSIGGSERGCESLSPYAATKIALALDRTGEWQFGFKAGSGAKSVFEQVALSGGRAGTDCILRRGPF